MLAAASLPLALASLIEAKGSQLEGSRILMYSYGSGLAAGMFMLKARKVAGCFALDQLQKKVSSASKAAAELLCCGGVCIAPGKVLCSCVLPPARPMVQ